MDKKIKIIVCSRLRAEYSEYVNQVADVPYIWISICDPDRKPSKPYQNDYHQGTLQLMFSDISDYTILAKMHERGKKYVKIMEYGHADQIVNFVNKHKDSIELILVHCEAGISRSAGCAAALDLWLNKQDTISNDPRYFPNSHVKSSILAVLRKKHLS